MNRVFRAHSVVFVIAVWAMSGVTSTARAEFVGLFGRTGNAALSGNLVNRAVFGDSAAISAILNTTEDDINIAGSNLVKIRDNQNQLREFVDLGNALLFRGRDRNNFLTDFVVDRFGQFRTLRTLDPQGRLSSLRGIDPLIVDSTTSFLARNRDNIRNRIVTDGYLANRANPGLVTGIFKFNLASLLDPAERDKFPQTMQTALQFFNYFMNTIQRKPILTRLDGNSLQGGNALVNLGAFYDRDQIALMSSLDPSFACTGAMRADRVIHDIFANPDFYEQIMGVSDGKRKLKLQQFARIRGFSPNQFDTSNNTAIIPKGESGITHNTRRLSILPQANLPGRICVMSRDVDDFTNTADSISQDPTIQPLAPEKGRELLCQNPNGFGLMGLLFDKEGNPLNEAPNSLVKSPVYTGVSCLKCHQTWDNMFLFGTRKQNGQAYPDLVSAHKLPGGFLPFTDRFGKQLTNYDFIISPGRYEQMLKPVSDSMRQVQAATNSLTRFNNPQPNAPRYVPPIPQTVENFNKPVTASKMALDMFGSDDPRLVSAVASFFGNPNVTLSRNSFESNLCAIRGAVLNRIRTGGSFAATSRSGASGGGFPVRSYTH